MPNAWAIGIASGIIIAKVPQELPVENDTKAPKMKMAAGTRPAEKFRLFNPFTMNSAVPRALIMLPRDQASTSVTATSVIPFIPST